MGAVSGILEETSASSEHSPPGLNAPLDVRSTALRALRVLAVVAVVFTLQQAKEFLLPIVLAALISYALSPLVARLNAWKIPRSLSAGVLLTALVILVSFSIYAFGDQLTDMVDRLPEGAQNLRQLEKAVLFKRCRKQRMRFRRWRRKLQGTSRHGLGLLPRLRGAHSISKIICGRDRSGPWDSLPRWSLSCSYPIFC